MDIYQLQRELEELKRTVKELEGRVKKLESKKPQQAPPADYDGSLRAGGEKRDYLKNQLDI